MTVRDNKQRAKDFDRKVALPVFLVIACVVIYYTGQAISQPVFNTNEAEKLLRSITKSDSISCKKEACTASFRNKEGDLAQIMEAINPNTNDWANRKVELSNGHRYVIFEYKDEAYRHRIYVGEVLSAVEISNPKR